MTKTYTVLTVPVIGAHRPAPLIDTLPPPPPALAGPKLTLGQQGNGLQVVGAGHDGMVNFATHDYVYTQGLMNCFAICAAWNKVGGVFSNGYLAHVSSPYGFCNTAIARIPANAFVVVGIGTGQWGAAVGLKLTQHGIPANNIWIYTRAQNGQVGFGLDKYGRFGEM